jgi:hypothetical protein
MHLDDQLITNALLATNGILSDTAKFLAERLRRPITRVAIAKRVEGSRVLQAVQQIAEERGWAGAVEIARKAKKQRRKVRNKELWAEKAHWVEDIRGNTWQAAKLADGAGDPEQSGRANVRACARASRTITAATLQAAHDRRLCGARTRKGTPCARRVVPGMNRCPNHGGKSTGPKTAEGKARIAAAQRARWQRYREERGAT